jgi:hypothetical protein
VPRQSVGRVWNVLPPLRKGGGRNHQFTSVPFIDMGQTETTNVERHTGEEGHLHAHAPRQSVGRDQR